VRNQDVQKISALDRGANDYLTKPFTVLELQQTVKTTLNKIYPDRNSGATPRPDGSVHIELQDMADEHFISPLHRTYFLAFSQNALSNRKRTFEKIAVHELIRAVALQLDAVKLFKNQDYRIMDAHREARIECDMYLLAGAIANLTLSFVFDTRGQKAPMDIKFELQEQELKVTWQKIGAESSSRALAVFEQWHQQPEVTLDPTAAMLVLAERAARMHQGRFKASPSQDVLAELVIPAILHRS